MTGARTPPACRAMPRAAAIKERVNRPRGTPGKRPISPAIEAIEREHATRVRHVREAYELERDRHRAMFTHAIEDCREREQEDIAELLSFRLELLREVGELTRATRRGSA